MANEESIRLKKLLAALEKHVDYLDADSMVLWAVVRALAAEVEHLHGLLGEMRNARPESPARSPSE